MKCKLSVLADAKLGSAHSEFMSTNGYDVSCSLSCTGRGDVDHVSKNTLRPAVDTWMGIHELHGKKSVPIYILDTSDFPLSKSHCPS